MDNKRKLIILFGGSGFLGQELGIYFTHLGFKIVVPSRHPDSTKRTLSFPADVVKYDDRKTLTEMFDSADVVINLIGESLAEGRWTEDKKKRILESRLKSTQYIVDLFDSCESKPALYIQASAVGYYSDSPSSVSSEESPAGDDFLADVCWRWEEASESLDKFTRRVITRFGVILGTTGGALPTIVDVYALGLGAQLGDGKQGFAWVHIQDILRFYEHATADTSVIGVYNLVSPVDTTQSLWHKTLKSEFKCLSPVRVPALGLKLLLGEKSQMLLSGGIVRPERTLKSGFEFKFPNLTSAVQDLIRRRSYPRLNFIHVKQWVPTSQDKVWTFFSDEKNLEQITPEFLNFHVVSMSSSKIEYGSIINYKLKLHGIPFKWRSLIQKWEPSRQFVDYQIKGPYKTWHHLHNFAEMQGGTLIEDFVHYRLPLWPLSFVAFPFVRKDVGNIFKYRQKILSDFLH